MDVLVKKRDGTIEPFHPEKIAKIAIAAGIDVDQALPLATRVFDWMISHSPAPISSSDIRDKVVEELRKISTHAADLYLWYESTKRPKSTDLPIPG